MKNFYRTAIATILGMFAATVAAQDLAAVVENCNGCHGDDGVSQWTDVPTIAGMPEFVHADALFIYKDGARPCAESKYRQGDTSRPATTMCAIAADLSEDDIEALAAAYAELPYVKAKQEFDADLAAAGKALHDDKCDRCHSDEGTNVEDEAGMLGGQQMGYLRDTFAAYMDGSREQPGKMKQALDAMSADDIEALVHYYGSVQ